MSSVFISYGTRFLLYPFLNFLVIASLISVSACGSADKNDKKLTHKASSFSLTVRVSVNEIKHTSIKPNFIMTFSQAATGLNENNIRLYKSGHQESSIPITIAGHASNYTFTPKFNLDYDSKYVVILKAAQIKNINDEPLHSADFKFSIKTHKKPLQFDVWIGANNSLIYMDSKALSDLASNTELYSYRGHSYKDCDIDNITACRQGQKLLLNKQPITDKALTLNTPAFYKLKEDNLVTTQFVKSEVQLPKMSHHQLVNFKDKIWLYALNYEGAIWSSSDALRWDKSVEINPPKATSFFAYDFQTIPVFQDKIWSISDADGQRQNHVWSSIDGITWKQELTNAPFSARTNHQTVVFQNKLWLIGGYGYGIDKISDIWSSSDGITWKQEVKSAAFKARQGHQLVVFKKKLWLIGGVTENIISDKTMCKDIWSSVDGITWKKELVNVPFMGRVNHQVVVFKDKLWLIAGANSKKLQNDIWSSVDGITWKQEVVNAPFTARVGHQVVVYKDKLWLIGGLDSKSDQNDVWQSVDGKIWRKGYLGEITRL